MPLSVLDASAMLAVILEEPGAEQDVAREPEIRAVELEFESDRGDGVVLGLHRVGRRLEVGLARGVGRHCRRRHPLSPNSATWC